MKAWAWAIGVGICLMLAWATIWRGSSDETSHPPAAGSVVVVGTSGVGMTSSPTVPPSSTPLSTVPTISADKTERTATSIVKDFVARSSAPLAVETSSCARSICRVTVLQTAEYVQRGKKFYESENFIALARASGVRSTTATSYASNGRSGYVIEMSF